MSMSSTGLSLAPSRGAPAEGVAPLRRVHRALLRHDGVAAELLRQQVIWHGLASPIARAWWPDVRDTAARPLLFELTVFLPRADRSRRWSDIAPLLPGRIAHHLPVRCQGDIDLPLLQCLHEAWHGEWRAATACRAGALWRA